MNTINPMSRKTISAARVHAQLDKLRNKANVAGYVVINEYGQHVGTVQFSYPRDGAGKLVALAADFTVEMPENVDIRDWTRWQYGWANGYGYDKHTAALSGMHIGSVTIADRGSRWDSQLMDAGYRVIQAV